MKFIKFMAAASILIVAAMYAWNNLFVSEQSHEVSSFNSIYVNGPINVFIEKSAESSVVVRADDNVHDKIKIRVENGELLIDQIANISRERILDVYINYESLDSIHASGASTLNGRNILTANSLKLHASGASEIKLQINSDSLDLIMDGAANVQLAGLSNYFKLYINDVGDLMAYNFQSKNCKVVMHTRDQSPGIARIHVTDHLDVSIKGPRELKFKGNPKVIKEITGEGSVVQY